jgi:hypothetical protein
MKRIAAIALLTASALMAAGSAMAQNLSLKVDIPFNFNVSNAVLPAGSYSISSDLLHPTTFFVRDSQGRNVAVETGLNDAGSRGKRSVLVFHKVGDQYFLSGIGFGVRSTSIFFPATKAEIRARKQLKKESYTSVATS